MKHLFYAAGLILVTACAQSAHTEAPSGPAIEKATYSVIADEFQMLVGEGWTGTLSYLDYTKEIWESIPVQLSVEAPKKRSISYAIKYPGESQYNSREKVQVSSDGTRLNGDPIMVRETLPDGTLRVVTEGPGKDDGKTAMIRMEYLAAPSAFVLRKYVKFDGTADFFKRNELSLSR